MTDVSKGEIDGCNKLSDPSTEYTCMAADQRTPVCPPGLEILLDAGQAVIHMDQDSLRWKQIIKAEAVNRMEVINECRQQLFHVEEDPYGDNTQSFMFRLYNKDQQEVITVFSPDCSTCVCSGINFHWFRRCRFQAMVSAPAGHILGFVRRTHTFLMQEFEILNAQEDVMLILRGGPEDLELYSPDLEYGLGRLAVHGWIGIMHETRRSDDDYGITFPLDLDVRLKAILIGAVFAIDWLYTTKGGKVL